MTEVTYLGVVHGTLAALRRMLPRDRGRMVQLGHRRATAIVVASTLLALAAAAGRACRGRLTRSAATNLMPDL